MKVTGEYIKNGYNVLNTGATGEGIGSLGGNILKWIKEKCQEEALKYKTRSEFQKKAGGAYNAAWKNKWLDEICAHMISPQKPSGYWTKERLQKEALKYKTRTEFFKKSSSAYDVSRKNGWLDEFCVHMETFSKPKGHWNNKENCRLEALKYKTRTEFSKKSICSYESSSKNKWLDEFFPK